jgi:microcin C transport system substrate-binding protein
MKPVLDARGRTRRRGLGCLLAGGLVPPLQLMPFKEALAAAAAAAPDAGNAAPDDGAALTGRWVHGFAAYGPPKYPAGFSHFDYVNPAAPRGGTLRLRNPDRRSSFDKFNPYTTRGNAPAGILMWMMEGLAHLSQDEPLTMYGLLAEEIWVAPDFSSVSFRVRPQARFNNGDKVTPEDIKHSFVTLTGKQSSPDVQTLLGGIERVEVVDSRTVRFDLREKTRDQVFVAGTMPVFSRKWGAGPGGEVRKFDEIVTDYPISTGPYRIDKVDMPRRIEFAFQPDYWAKDLGVRRGQFNFLRVVYRNYNDQPVAREAFKAGEFDIYKEYGARSWVRQHKGVKWDDGRIRKQSFVTGTGQGLQSYQLNLRLPKFQDARVREALGYTYDFETLNKTGAFKRANSVFNNSAFAAQGSPSPGELKLLEPWRSELPARVFGPAFVAPSTAGDPNGLRRNLLKARELFEQAGWKLGDGDKLRNAKGEAFEIEYMTPRDGGLEDWARNLQKLGVTLKDRVVDFALYARRLEEYDFEMVTIVEYDFTLPKAGNLAGTYGSKAALEKGNGNYRGVQSRAADAMIAAVGAASTMQELTDAARALDRVVMWNFWQVPDLYQNAENLSFWNRFGMPKTQALYFAADTMFSGVVEFAPWPLWAWWDKSLEGKA